MREQDCPFSVKKVMEFDLSMCSLRLKVGRNRSNPQAWLLCRNHKTTAEGSGRALNVHCRARDAVEGSRSCTRDESRHGEV